MTGAPFRKNTLYYGDNIDWMREWPDREVADLIYLDPPFNSNQAYNVLYGAAENGGSAQVRAFNDTWRWGGRAESDKAEAMGSSDPLRETVMAFEKMLPESPMLAYLCHLAPRLRMLHRLLKRTGSIHLHCDDTAGPHIKLLMDAVFGPANYRNLIIWRRAVSHNDASRFGRIADLILFYSKGDGPYWNGDAIAAPRSAEELREAYPSKDSRGRFRSDNLTGPWRGTSGGSPSTAKWRRYDVFAKGRCWSPPKTGSYAKYIEERFIPGYRKIKGVHDRLDALDEAGLIRHPGEKGAWPGLKRYAEADRGKPPQNIILDPAGFTNFTKGDEWLGYPTQKPEALLRKLIDAACPPDGLVLDPYCGCGTALHVAEAIGRPWVGIDATHLAVGIIEHRFSERLNRSVDVVGQPKDMAAARDLFGRDPFQFEAWAVTRLQGFLPSERQRGDGGIDGRGYVRCDGENLMVVAQVKGGRKVRVGAVRELGGTMAARRAALGILIVMEERALTRAAKAALDHAPVAIGDREHPRMQVWTMEDFFSGKRPDLPRLLPVHRDRRPDLFDAAAEERP